MEEKVYICSVCGENLLPSETFEFDEEYYCEECLDEMTSICDHCGSRVPEEETVCDSNYTLCRECYNDHYSHCEDCGRIIANEDCYYMDDYEEFPYCYSCYQHNQRYRGIHDYNYKPDPIFHGSGSRFFGVELEVDNGGYLDDNARQVLEIANEDHEENLYIKHDGSLDEGFELVSHPMTLEYHKNYMPWQDIMKRLVGLGYRSHKTSTCGLHCHVNRSAFGDTIDEQEDAIGRVLYFVERHWNEMLRFSRRTEGQMQRWAARYGAKGNPKDMMEDVKSGSPSRYRCVNIQNYSTIEFRMFRGTLKYNTFIATLQLVNEICNVAVFMSDEEIQGMSWQDFVNRLDDEEHRELITFLKERNLYKREAE